MFSNNLKAISYCHDTVFSTVQKALAELSELEPLYGTKIRTKEDNRLKDKMEALSLNYSKANLVKSTIPTNRDKFKGKGKKNQKSSYPK